MNKESSKRWIEAGIIIGNDSRAKVSCPECEKNDLEIKDVIDETVPNKIIGRLMLCNECGAHNELRLNKIVSKIKLMADYQCYPLWRIELEDMGNIDPASLPISKVLQDDLNDWAKRFDSILNWEDPALSCFKTKQDELNFIEQGECLAKRLQEELGCNYEVIYHSL